MGDSAPQAAEKVLVIRDRRKPNQYTTDNIIAREWLPILRTGDAFFFYSVYLSMANKETESSWSSLRTLAQYLQCGVDLIIRGNKLLEICELIYVETGNQRTSNEYYILDPPTLTPELRERISKRLDEIAAQQPSQNWQSWVRQVRNALDRHRSLTDIWAERRARRGGRPTTRRPQPIENGAREPQPGFPEKGACEPQPQRMWDTTSAHVSHKLSGREPQPEQERQTSQNEQTDLKDPETLLLLVRRRCRHLGIADPIIDIWLERYTAQHVARQLEWLPLRQPRDPAAMLVSAVQGDWDRPAHYDAKQSSQLWAMWLPDAAGEAPAIEPGTGNAAQGRDTSVFTVEGTSLDTGEIWTQVLEELRMQMTRATFDTWLHGSRVVGVENGELVVLVRDSYAVDWLRARWLAPIQRTVAGIVGRSVAIRFEAA
jgi:hypothetical protein